jgi:hypothetical protein
VAPQIDSSNEMVALGCGARDAYDASGASMAIGRAARMSVFLAVKMLAWWRNLSSAALLGEMLKFSGARVWLAAKLSKPCAEVNCRWL